MQRNTGYFPTESLEPSGNRLFSRSALNEGDLFRGSLAVLEVSKKLDVSTRFLVARILTLEAYSLGVMPVTFLKWREK